MNYMKVENHAMSVLLGKKTAAVKHMYQVVNIAMIFSIT